VAYRFVHFEVDFDFVIAIISDGTQEWNVAATVSVQGNTLTLRGFHMHGPGHPEYGGGKAPLNGSLAEG
jgi:hypothetical protein